MSKVKDMTGQKFDLLTVIKQAGTNHDRHALWECICECGNKTTVLGYNLRKGVSGSCGCRHKTNLLSSVTKHGLAKRSNAHPLYQIYQNMKARCCNPTNKSYHNYGGRGIIVCSRWLEDDGLLNFIADMGICPSGMSLDRIDVNGNYEPSNCRWVTWKKQCQNRRRRFSDSDIRLIRSIKIKTVDLARILGVNYGHIHLIRSGKSYADVV